MLQAEVIALTEGMKKLGHRGQGSALSHRACQGPTADCPSLRLLIQWLSEEGCQEPTAHTENKGAFSSSCGGLSSGCSGQEAGHCEETAVLGAKPIEDVALGSKGTLFIPYPGSGCCWAGSDPSRCL